MLTDERLTNAKIYPSQVNHFVSLNNHLTQISIYIIENVGERASAHTPLKPGLTYGGGKDLMGEPMGEMIFKKIQKK